MNATILNYPGFQTLPKGVKQMLLMSETHFFKEAVPPHFEDNSVARAATPAAELTALLHKFTECAAQSALSLRRFRAGALGPQLASGYAR